MGGRFALLGTRAAYRRSTENRHGSGARYLNAASLALVFAAAAFGQSSSFYATLNNTSAPAPPTYSYEIPLTVQSGQVSGTLTNFPMLVAGTFATLKSTGNGGHVQNASGYDIIFTSDSLGKNLLPFERVSWSATTGAVEFWVNVSSIQTGTVIYMVYGSSGAALDRSNPTGTWDANYFGVYHLQGTSATDSTWLQNNLTVSGTPTSAAGEIGNGWSLGGSAYAYLKPAAGQPVGNQPLTVECWTQIASISSGLMMACGMGGFNNRDTFNLDARPNANTYQTNLDNDNYNVTSYTPDTSWHLWVGTYAGTIESSIVLYLDGAADAGSVVYTPNGTLSFPTNASTTIGTWASGGANGYNQYNWSGGIDEVRLSSIARSAAWIQAEYNNMHAPASFYSAGSEVAPH